MSYEVFSQMESVYFVTDEAQSIEDAGGCTLAYVIANGGFKNFDPESIMGGDGAPICESSDATYSSFDGKIYGGGANDFADAEVGMVAMIYGLDNEGRYEILEADPSGGWIRIRGGVSADVIDDADVYVGGSFDTISNALDNITAADAGGHHDCYLFTNQSEVITAQPIVSGGGNIEYNTKLFITGFNTTLLDMFPGGAYYQSASDAWYDGIDADCHVDIDLDDVDALLFSADNIITQNIRFKNNSAGSCLEFAANSSGLIFRNCIVDEATKVIYGFGGNRSVCFIDCFIWNATINLVKMDGAGSSIHFVNCVIDAEINDIVMLYISEADSTCTVSGCLLLTGKWSYVGSAHIVEWNNTVIGHADNLDGHHRINAATGIRICFDSIVILPQACELVSIAGSGGSVLYADRLCLWGADGAEYAGDYGVTAKSGGSIGRRDFNVIEVDPELDNDYRPRNPQVLRGGSAMLSDGRSQLGAIKQKYQFPQKGRTVNHGRLGILK